MDDKKKMAVEQLGTQAWFIGDREIHYGCGMIRRFGAEKLVVPGSGGFAAFVCIGLRGALALLAAVRSLLGPRAACKAVERLCQQQDSQNSYRNVNATAHFYLERSRYWAGVCIDVQSPSTGCHVGLTFTFDFLRDSAIGELRPYFALYHCSSQSWAGLKT